jgi:hypothetical protein
MDGALDVDEPRGGFSRFAGCLVPLLVVAILGIGGFGWFKWNAPRGQFPSEVRIAEVLEFNSQGFFREGCTYGLYRLDSATASRLRSEGVGFLATSGRPRRENPRNPYGRWQQTPLALEPRQHVLALAATTCSTPRATVPLDDEGRARSVERALASPGSFFAFTQNREGLLVIDPGQELAWFLYFG